MLSATRKILVCSLLAAYGAVALLGQGLHWLSAVDHHHHGLVAHCHEHAASHSHTHDHGHSHHHAHKHAPDDCCTAAADGVMAVRSSDGAASCEECDICAFLSQIKCDCPQVADAPIWQFVISSIPVRFEPSYSPITLGPHAPRGPPISQA